MRLGIETVRKQGTSAINRMDAYMEEQRSQGRRFTIWHLEKF